MGDFEPQGKSSVTRRRLLWPAAAVLIGAIFSVTAGIVLYKVLSRPFEMVEKGGASFRDGVLEIMGTGGELFRRIVSDPKIEERYYSFASSGKPVQELNVYKMERLEFESRRIKRLNSVAHIGFVVPVEYTYYVDVSRKWRMSLENGILKVVVPDLKHQRPNPYWEKCDDFVEGGLLVTGEKEKLKAMKDEYPSKLDEYAAKYCDAPVVEQARASVAMFLNGWISKGLKEHYISGISIRFESEKDFPKMEYSTRGGAVDPLIEALSKKKL